MKAEFFHKPIQIVFALLAICILYFNQAGFASGIPVNQNLLTEKEPAKKGITFSARNNNAVRIHPDIIRREMHVVAKENNGKEINFFVFDLQGTLIQYFKMKHKDHFKMKGLEKGTYIYRVFEEDEETVSGKFDIR
jgi:hypothetical protein